jgi:multiple sugar transport system substrate-binding protein
LRRSGSGEGPLAGIIWCYGAKTVEADGKTVAINSRETQAAIEFVKQLYSDAMEPDVLVWDDNNNNRLLLSGKGAWIHTPHSHYLMAVAKQLPIAEQIYFHLSPQGPAGRHTPTVIRSLGLWKFSNNIEAAKEFLKFHSNADNYSEFISTSECFDAPGYKNMEGHPAWKRMPNTNQLETMAYTAIYTAGQRQGMTVVSR